MALEESDQSKPHRLLHFTPLRYPGGKAKLALYVKALMKANHLLDGEYVEPYAGGAAIALELLFHEYVSRVHINDVSIPVHSFWKCVLEDTDRFCSLVRKTPLTVHEWDKHKQILSNLREHDQLEIGFATFYLNRTNRSGILNGGIIGGRDQTGPWKIDARFNAKELVQRIQAIAAMKDRIKLTSLDALKFLKSGMRKWPAETLVYLDPPYYVKGRELYYDFYQHRDHEKVAEFMMRKSHAPRWIVSYDNVTAIREFYKGTRHIAYDIGYSARAAARGSEVMFFCDGLRVPKLIGPIKVTEDNSDTTLRIA